MPKKQLYCILQFKYYYTQIIKVPLNKTILNKNEMLINIAHSKSHNELSSPFYFSTCRLSNSTTNIVKKYLQVALTMKETVSFVRININFLKCFKNFSTRHFKNESTFKLTFYVFITKIIKPLIKFMFTEQ